MADPRPGPPLSATGLVNTVTGPVQAAQLGRTVMSEALLSIVPGASLAPEWRIDRSQVYRQLRNALREFADLGGGTIVDTGGLTLGRDVDLYRLLSEDTGVQVVVATGLASQEYIGSWFLNPLSMTFDPPRRFPVQDIATIFRRELIEGTVDPPRRRLAPAGVITVQASPDGLTDVEGDVFQAGARTALSTGAALCVKTGTDPVGEVDTVLGEGLGADRVYVTGLDRPGVDGSLLAALIGRGVNICIDQVGWPGGPDRISDDERVRRVSALVDDGYVAQLVLAGSVTGVSIGREPGRTDFRAVLGELVPRLKAAGVDQDAITRMLEDNPRRLLTLSAVSTTNEEDAG